MIRTLNLLLFAVSLQQATLADEGDNNCKTWPKFSKLPIECCSVPELVAFETKQKCIANCTRPTEPSFNSWCCTTQCIFDDLGLTVDGDFSRDSAKRILPKAFENVDKISKVLSEIIDKCDDQIAVTELKQDEGKSECSTLKYGYIWSCIYQELMKVCPESKPDKECVEVKDFMEKCPNLKPPLKQTKLSSASLTEDNLGLAMTEVIHDENQNAK